MKHLTKALFVVAALSVSACANKDVDNYAGEIGGDAYGAGGAGANGGVSDPTSIAYFQQTVGDRILFVVDQSTLNDTARGILVTQAQWLNANPEYTAVIEGHADEQGTREYNLALGARRANAVQEYLISQGVSGSRLQVLTYGKERPLEVCSQESCYSKNRRAVTVLAAGGLTS
ncbi:MAG: peptidoglycan-associated lipoprotein Pal [Pseudoruegeria sp.]